MGMQLGDNRGRGVGDGLSKAFGYRVALEFIRQSK